MALILPNSIFLGVPKTGCVWVHRVVYAHADKRGWEYDRLHNLTEFTSPYAVVTDKGVSSSGHCWITYQKDGRTYRDDRFPKDRSGFCFVRDPVSWYRSYWIFKAKVKEKWEPEKCVLDQRYLKFSKKKKMPYQGSKCKQEHFETFLRAALSLKDPYLSWLYDAFTKDCTHVGRYENLRQDLIDIFTAVGEDFSVDIIDSIKPVNVAGSATEDFQVPEDIREEIRRKENYVIDKYGYKGVP